MRVQRGVHYRKRHQVNVCGALLAHDPGTEWPRVSGREPRALTESEAGVVGESGALHPQGGVVVPEAQVVEAHATDVAGLSAQHRDLFLQRLLALRRREGAMQCHLATHRMHCGGKVAPFAFVRPPGGAIKAVSVAPDEEHG